MSSVLGALFAVVVGLLAVRPIVAYQQSVLQNIQTAATAGELRQIADAAQSYIQTNFASVEANSTATTPATITIPMLESTGFLPAAVSTTNSFGQTWVVQVLQPTAGQLQALVLSTGGGTIPERQAPAIAAQAGQEGGFIPFNGQFGTLSSNAAQGAFGHWSIAMAGYTNPGPGHLAALVAFDNGNLQNDYLYRVGVPGAPQLNTMQTAINLNGNNLNFANNVDSQLLSNSRGPNIVVQSVNGPTQAQNLILTNGNVALESGGLSASGTVSGATVDASQNVNAGGNVVGAGTVQGGLINSTGIVNAENAFTAGSGFTATAAGNVSASNEIFAANTIGAGNDVIADQVVQAGFSEVLGTASGGASSGNGCSPNGEIAASADGSGVLEQCVDGRWSPPGGFLSASQSVISDVQDCGGNATLEVGLGDEGGELVLVPVGAFCSEAGGEGGD